MNKKTLEYRIFLRLVVSSILMGILFLYFYERGNRQALMIMALPMAIILLSTIARGIMTYVKHKKIQNKDTMSLREYNKDIIKNPFTKGKRDTEWYSKNNFPIE